MRTAQLWITVEISSGMTILDAAKEAIRISKETGLEVKFDFSGVTLRVTGDETPESVRDDLRSKLEDSRRNPPALESWIAHKFRTIRDWLPT